MRPDPDRLWADAERAFALIPGKHRFNLHAFYGDFGGKLVDRDAVGPEHDRLAVEHEMLLAQFQRRRDDKRKAPSPIMPTPAD